jgi:hypothetical protein
MLTDPLSSHPAYLRLACDALASRAERAVATLACVNLMDQCFPAGGKVGKSAYPDINRKLASAEFRETQRIASDLGLQRLDFAVRTRACDNERCSSGMTAVAQEDDHAGL